MSIHRYQATWRSLTFNTHLDNSGLVDDPAHLVAANINSRYSLDECEPNRVSVQDYRELRQFLEGGEPNEAFEGVRAINGAGRIFGATVGDLEDRAWALNEAFSVAAARIAAAAAADTAHPGLLPFSFRRDTVGGNRRLRFYCRPGPGRPVWIGRRGEGLVRPYSFQLIAFDPFAYDEVATQTLVPIPGGGNVTNPGNAYVRPVITIRWAGGAGSATFILTNTTTGKAITLDLSGFGAAGGVVLDVTRGTIVDEATGLVNRYSSRVSGWVTDMFLLAGANAFTLANTTHLTAVQFDFRGAYA